MDEEQPPTITFNEEINALERVNTKTEKNLETMLENATKHDSTTDQKKRGYDNNDTPYTRKNKIDGLKARKRCLACGR